MLSVVVACVVVVLPENTESAAVVFLTQSDVSLCGLLHSAEAVFISKGFAGDGAGGGVFCPAIDMGNTFRMGCW